MPLQLGARPTVAPVRMPSFAGMGTPAKEPQVQRESPGMAEGRQLDNALKYNKLQDYEVTREQREVAKEATGLSAYFDARSAGMSHNNATEMTKRKFDVDTSEIKIHPDSGIDLPIKDADGRHVADFSIKGKLGELTSDEYGYMSKAMGVVRDTGDPMAFFNPHTRKILGEHGLKFKLDPVAATSDIGKLRKFKKAGKEITEEFTAKGWVSKAEAPAWKPGDGDSKTYLKDPEKLVDDTRGYYSLKMKTLLDEDGYIKEGQEEAYKELSDRMDSDMIAIGKGEKPSWISEKYDDAESVKNAFSKGELTEEEATKILQKEFGYK